jgi:phage terminase small subunit
MADKEAIRKAYEDGEGTFKVLSELYEVSEGTIKCWAKQDKDKGQPWIKPSQPKPVKKVEKKVEVDEAKSLIVVDDKSLKELPEKQRIFVAEYLKDFNATRAALAAGYSKHTAYSIGCNLLKKVEVQNEIKKQTEALFDSIGLTAQRILMEYMKVAFADINNYLTFGQKEVPVMTMYGPLKDEDGNEVMKTVNYVDFKESSEVDTSLVSEVKQGKDGVSIKLHDKMKALDTLAKYMHLIVDNVNLQQNNIIIKLEDD